MVGTGKHGWDRQARLGHGWDNWAGSEGTVGWDMVLVGTVEVGGVVG